MKKYELIYEDIVRDIKDGKIIVGQCLPSEMQLQQRFGVSRSTIRMTLETLVREGYIIKVQGKGSVLANVEAKQKTVLILVHDLYTYIYGKLISQIEAILRENKIATIISLSYRDHEIEKKNLKTLLPLVDGVIIDPTATKKFAQQDKSIYKKLEQIPAVSINAKIDSVTIKYLVLNDYEAMCQLTDYVLTRGVKRVLIVSKNIDNQGYDRECGIKDTLAKHNVMYQVSAFTTQSELEVAKKVKRLIEKYNFDCIMFHNDQYAYVFKQYYLSKTNKEILVTGFDGYNPLSNDDKIPSVIHPCEKMGFDAAHMILKQFSKIDDLQSKIYEIELANIEK